MCTSTAFQTAATACLTANCTAADLANAEALVAGECSVLYPSVSSGVAQTTAIPASISGAAHTTAQTTATSVSTKASSPFSSFNAALGGEQQFVFAGMVSAVVGALVGGVLAL